MTEHNPLATSSMSPPPAETAAAYRPVSVLAIAGLGLALMFVLVVGVSAVVAFSQGSTVFLPTWTLLFPVLAVVISLVAIWDIRNAEGTRAGLGLARWGLGLSLFIGLGYLAYDHVTGLAVKQQANAFLMTEDADSGFFPHLMKGETVDINAAFLLTQLPESRTVDPRDERKIRIMFDRPGEKTAGQLTRFREHPVIRAIIHGKQLTRIEPLGVQWESLNNRFKVTRHYRVTTPEMLYEIVLPVASTAASEGEERKWFVMFPKLEIKKADLAPLGYALVNASNSAQDFARMQANGLAPPGFKDLTNWETVAPDEARKAVRDEIKKWLDKGGPHSAIQLASPATREAPVNPWEIHNSHLRFNFGFSCQIVLPVRQETWVAAGTLTVEDRNPLALDADNLPQPNSLQAPDWQVLFEARRFTIIPKLNQ